MGAFFVGFSWLHKEKRKHTKNKILFFLLFDYTIKKVKGEKL